MTYTQIAVIFGTMGVLSILPMMGIFGARLKGSQALWLIPMAILVFAWGFAWPITASAMITAVIAAIYYSFTEVQ